MKAGPREWSTRSDSFEVPGETASRGSRALRRFGMVAWFVTLCGLWFDVTKEDFAVALGSAVSSQALTGAAFAAVAGRVGFQLLEAAFYTLVWRLLARPIRYGPLFVAVVSLSILDALASVLVRMVGSDASPVWLAVLVGIRVLPGVLAGESGLRLAFGGFGVLTLLRVLGTAYAQRREGPSWRGALTLTLAVWLAGRLATWWTADLMRGMSPLP